MGYSMSADEITFWQEQAALLDPLAYVWTLGSGATVTATEPWFLVNGWNIASISSGVRWFHRTLDVDKALRLPAGYTLTNAALSSAYTYVCKPELVTASDTGGPGGSNRYTSDPRALYFDRIEQLNTLTHYHLGATATGSGQSNASFPGGFTYGMLLGVSNMDVAWTVLLDSTNAAGLNTLGEISDTAPIRWAEKVVVPFAVATFPKLLVQGVSLSTGAGNVVYVQLPAGW